MSSKRVGMAVALGAALAVAAATLPSSVAEAQTEPVQLESGAKGAVGLGLIGAELGFFIPAAVGLHELWAFIVFPIVGGAGGAIGGYFALDEPNNVELSVAFLAIGMGLILPTVVATLAFTAYDPGDVPEGSEDDALEEEFETERAPAQPESEASGTRERLLAGGGLVHVRGSGAVQVGVPSVAVRETYSREELARYGGERQSEVHVPVVSGTF